MAVKKRSKVLISRTPFSSKLPTNSTQPSNAQRWTFLTNHTHVLALIQSDPEMLLREVADRIGITERAVQRIVQELAEAGYLNRERVGRRNRYSVVLHLPLRHPIEAHQTIGPLLQLVNSKH